MNAEDLLADLNDLPEHPPGLPNDPNTTTDEASIDEFLAEFSKEKTSRPLTPRVLPGKGARASPRLNVNAHTDKARKSGETARASSDSKRSVKDETQTFTNSSTNSDKSEDHPDAERQESKKVYGGGASWSSWGGSLWNTANTIQSQLRAEAEKRLADLQASEEAQALQSKFRELDLKNIDLAKIASEARNLGKGVLDAVAPPIDDNETLVVNVLHDLTGLPVETPIYNSFDRVMDQVEGGSLKIIARDRTGTLDLSVAQGSTKEAEKMASAAIEDSTKASKSEDEERMSVIYLSIQAFSEPSEDEEQETRILMTLLDPSNTIKFTATSQSFPTSWTALSLITVEASMQPREWITEWLTESITLTAGILAQRYVARRMAIDQPAEAESETSLKVKEGQDLSEAGLGL